MTASGPDAAAKSGVPKALIGRRTFLTYLIAAPTLTVAVDIGQPASAHADPAKGVLSPPRQFVEIGDLGDLRNLAAAPTSHLITVTVGSDGRVGLELPRTEVGQGITTSMAMIVAEEMDVTPEQVDVTLAPARAELRYNQLTGGSNTIRSMYAPVRHAAAVARALRDTRGPKPRSQQRIVGTPTSRTDAGAMVTGQLKYTVDLDVVPGALPTMVRRPPTINGTVSRIENAAQVREMPGVVDLVTVPTGVAVLAETFGQALDAKNALQVVWNGGTIDGESDESLRRKLRAVLHVPTGVPEVLPSTDAVEAEFDIGFISHAPLQPNSAIADVRDGQAAIWARDAGPDRRPGGDRQTAGAAPGPRDVSRGAERRIVRSLSLLRRAARGGADLAAGRSGR